MMTKALHHCECVNCLPTCVHMLASPSGSCSQPPGPREISHDAVERHSVWLTLECGGGRLEVWLADAMRPGMLLKVWFSEADLAHTQKKIELISYLTLCSFCVSSGQVTYKPWFHACVSRAIRRPYCHLSQVQVSTWIIMWSLANTIEHFCLSFLKAHIYSAVKI